MIYYLTIYNMYVFYILTNKITVNIRLHYKCEHHTYIIQIRRTYRYKLFEQMQFQTIFIYSNIRHDTPV